MLKKRVTDLIVQYEFGAGGWITADEVLEELEEILDDESWIEELSRPLQNAVNAYIIARHECNRCHGHCDDGSDAFIAEVERIISFE